MGFAPKLAATFGLFFALSACSPGTAQTTSSTSRPSISATTTAPPTNVADCPPTPINVIITYALVTDPSGGITIEAASNLPNGASMNASFFVEGDFFAQDDGTLDNGKISFGPFSDKGTPLKGTYEMSITLPIARLQPATVRACIGPAGELLAGPLVSAEEITGDNVASLDVVVTVE